MRMLLSLGSALATCALLFAGAAHRTFAQPSKAAAKTSAQQTSSGSPALSQAQIDSIIRAFTAKETEFRRALNEYGFKRDALIQSLGMGGQVSGEYHRVSHFTFDDKANRYEKIDFFPMPSLEGVAVTPEDLEDLGGVNPFALEASKLNEYNFKYVGKERIDELDLFVFDVSPKVMPDAKKTKERFFVGRIWVDDHDLQIVKSKGKGVPETKRNKFPVVETYREQIGKYWFPTYAYADDDLIFDNGNDQRIRMLVKYTDYEQARATVRITELNEAKPEPQKPESQSSEARTKPSERQPIEGGVLNGKAIELPAPEYPKEAREAHLAGEVQVKVLVDENGNVISAEAVFGPEPLRDAAVGAAKRARFTPTRLAGVPVKVYGIIIYKFVAQ